MIKQILTISLNAIVLTIIFGCSGNNSIPVSPQDSIPILDESTLQTDPYARDRIILDAGSFDLNPNIGTIVINPNRDLAGWTQNHLDVKPFVPAPTVQLISYNPLLNIYDVNVTINNNSIYDGYDVRLIIHTTDRGILLVNDDNWTPLWDAVGGSLINPFKAYAKLEPNRKFAAHTSHTERFQLYLPSGSGSVSFAIDASAGGNCVEPYKISNFTQGPLHQFIDSSTTVEVEVYDWQDNADVVALYCPEITGGIWESFSQISSYKWQLNLVNSNAAPEGEYLGIIKATSSDLGSLVLYDFVTISVTQGTPTTDWTILIYMHEESDLVTYSVQDINEMEVAGSLEGRLNIIVLWDKLQGEDVILEVAHDPNGDDDNIVSPTINDYGEVIPPEGLNMASEETLEKFLRWSFKNYPAKQYGLIFWDHGNGPIGLEPENGFVKYCCGGLQVWAIRNACQTVLSESTNCEFSFIGFDCCLMSWIETAYCLKDVCLAGIASELPEPLWGWRYQEPLVYLRDNISTCSVNELCELFVDSYLAHVTYFGWTLAAWRSEKLNSDVIPAINEFSNCLIAALSTDREHISGARFTTGLWGGDLEGTCNQEHVKDLGYFAKEISQDYNLPEYLRNSADNLVDAIEGAMIRHGHFGSVTIFCPLNETGWEIWFPNDYDDCQSRQFAYQQLGFSETNWDDFLNAFDE